MAPGRGVRLAAVSDIYLREATLREVQRLPRRVTLLEDLEIHVSCELGFGKGSGLWERTQEVLGVAPGRIVHFGDNPVDETRGEAAPDGVREGTGYCREALRAQNFRGVPSDIVPIDLPASPPEDPARAAAPPFAAAAAAAAASGGGRRLNRAAVLRIALVAAVAASLVFAIASQWSKLPDIEWHFRPGWLALSLAGLLAFEWMHIELWRGMLRTMGGRLPRWRGRSIWATTLLARYVPTSVLMAVGRVTLSEKEGVPKRVTTASVVYEVALTFTASVVISSYLVLRLPAFEDHATRWLVLLVPIVGTLAMHPRIFHPIADFALRRIGSDPLPLALSFGRVLYYLFFFLVSFVVAGVAVLAMTLALHPVDASDYVTVIASYSLGFTAGVIGFLLPGALGAREAGVVVAVTAAVPAAVALAVALVLRLVQVGVELGYAATMSLIARRRAAE